MKLSGEPWTLSSILLALAGTALVGAGLYFVFLRPPLLPEDVRYMGLSAVELDAVRPRLDAWLTQVFRVMGGYVIATGVLAVALAATSFRTLPRRHEGRRDRPRSPHGSKRGADCQEGGSRLCPRGWPQRMPWRSSAAVTVCAPGTARHRRWRASPNGRLAAVVGIDHWPPSPATCGRLRIGPTAASRGSGSSGRGRSVPQATC
jgi:hypothetical protein